MHGGECASATGDDGTTRTFVCTCTGDWEGGVCQYCKIGATCQTDEESAAEEEEEEWKWEKEEEEEERRRRRRKNRKRKPHEPRGNATINEEGKKRKTNLIGKDWIGENEDKEATIAVVESGRENKPTTWSGSEVDVVDSSIGRKRGPSWRSGIKGVLSSQLAGKPGQSYCFC